MNYLEVAEIVTTTATSAAGTAVSSSGNGITMDDFGYTAASPATSASGAYVPLSQFHFHTPSENTIDGVHYPLEMHMVHKAFSNPTFANGTMTIATVIAVMFKLRCVETAVGCESRKHICLHRAPRSQLTQPPASLRMSAPPTRTTPSSPSC